MTPRTIDHLVLAYPTLGEARSAFTALGFFVAPDAAHPFGTGNACVFLADGAYLEPLAVLDRDAARRAGDEGNSFAAHALAMEQRAPTLSAVALASADAAADREGFAARGFGGADLLAFSRPYRDGEGRDQTLSFRLAFARSPTSGDTLVFTCERLPGTVPDRTAYTRHPNGVTGMARLVFAGGREASAVLEDVLGFASDRLRPPAVVMTPTEIAHRYGVTVGSPVGGLRLAGLVLECDDPAVLRSAASEGTLLAVGDRLVHPLPGGGFLAFEEAAGE